MSTFDRENENFYKASILVWKHGSDVVRKLMETHCEKTWTSLPEFLTKHRHSLYHMMQKDRCCQCTETNYQFYPGHLLKSHWCDLFHVIGNSECRKKSLTFKLCSCDATVIPSIRPRSLDVITLTTIFLNIDEFRFETEVVQALLDIRRLRNKVLSLGETGKLCDAEYEILTGQAQRALYLLAGKISAQYGEYIFRQTTNVLVFEINMHDLVDVITVMKNSNEREKQLLTVSTNIQFLLVAMLGRSKEKKKDIWLTPMTKAHKPTEKSKKQRHNTKIPPKTSLHNSYEPT